MKRETSKSNEKKSLRFVRVVYNQGTGIKKEKKALTIKETLEARGKDSREALTMSATANTTCHRLEKEFASSAM